jgi:hypothetical protein
MKKTQFLLIIFILLASCNSVSDASKILKNEKIKTTDEFLVKKRDPLILPPNFEEMPKPNSIRSLGKKSEEETIKEILKAPKTEDFPKNKSTSIEESILDRIRK